MAEPRPPKDLKAAGRRVWRQTLAAVEPGWTLDERDLVVLCEAGRQADLIDRLERQLEADGLMVEGAKGQPRLHAAVTALIAARALLARLLVQVEVRPPAAQTGKLSGRQRAELRTALTRVGRGSA
jgi:hypothetical protein